MSGFEAVEACVYCEEKSLLVVRSTNCPASPGANYPVETAAFRTGTRSFRPRWNSRPAAAEHLPNQGVPQDLLPGRPRQGVELLVLAGPQPHPHLNQLEQVLELSADERAALSQAGSMLPVSITPYYMSLVSRDDSRQPLRRTVIPTMDELAVRPARPTIPWAKTTTAPCQAWCIAIPTGFCCW